MVLSANADDFVVLVKDQQDVDTLVRLADVFSTLSSLNVNWGKCVALAASGRRENLPSLPQSLGWKTEGF